MDDRFADLPLRSRITGLFAFAPENLYCKHQDLASAANSIRHWCDARTDGIVAWIACRTGRQGPRHPKSERPLCSMLQSRTLSDALIQKFNLMNVYKVKR